MTEPEAIEASKESSKTSEDDMYGYPKGIKTYLPQILAVSVKNIILLSNQQYT